MSKNKKILFGSLLFISIVVIIFATILSVYLYKNIGIIAGMAESILMFVGSAILVLGTFIFAFWIIVKLLNSKGKGDKDNGKNS